MMFKLKLYTMEPLMKIMIFSNIYYSTVLAESSGSSINAIVYESNGSNKILNSINEFGYNLVKTMMAQNENDNIIISPISISGLLAMTLIGTVGKTNEEIADSLGFSHDIYNNRRNHEEFSGLLQQINSESIFTKSLYASSVFVDINTKLREHFREYINRLYRSNAFNIDFKDVTSAKDTINKWVQNNTEGRTEQFLTSTLPKETKVVLLSAYYFRGQWLHPFLPEFTTKMPFIRPNNGNVLADFMLNVGEFKYVFSEKYAAQMVALPYNDSITTMYILKPMKASGLRELLTRLDYLKIDDLINQMTLTKCIIRLPKMELQRTSHLEAYLKSMRMTSMFEPQEANFGLLIDNIQNITQNEILAKTIKDNDREELRNILNNLPNPGIYVNTVLHDAKLIVNEYGTEVVAASAAILARTAQQFYADSAFYMFIRNDQTKLITFTAIIFDPTA